MTVEFEQVDAGDGGGARPEAIPPSAQIKAVDDEIQRRFAKRTGSLDRFLQEWLKLDDSQALLFDAIGVKGENYFQHVLAKNDLPMGLALPNILGFFAQTEVAERVLAFLEHTDAVGNDIWHYLASCLNYSETDEGLTIARTLIELEISFTRKNDEEETALSKLLLPEPKWKSINSMNTAKKLTVSDFEDAFGDAINKNEAVRQEVMVNVFSSDLADNDALLTTSILSDALSSQAERPDRAKAAALFFDAIGGARRETIFMKTADVEVPDVFDRLLDLLAKCVEDDTREVAARDGSMAFAQQQVLLYRRLSKRNRSAQNYLIKSVIGDRPKQIGVITTLLKNENLIVAQKDERGQTIHANVTVDEKSPAPRNPVLSMLLQQDVRGNTAYHTAAFLSRTDCLRRLFGNLSIMDSFMIVTKIPNRYGVTVQDSLDPKLVKTKIGAQLKAGKINQADASQLVGLASKQDRDTKDFLNDLINRANDMLERTGGISEAKPTFDLKKVPTVALHIRELMKKRQEQASRG